jgi:hypothetical protein
VGDEGVQAVAPARGAGRETGDVAEVVEVGPQRIEAADRLGGAVDRALVLGGVAAEQAVPEDEDAAVVLVEVLRVGGVVDAVQGGGVEDALEAAELADELGVQPELVERVEALAGGVDQRWDAEQGERGAGRGPCSGW